MFKHVLNKMHFDYTCKVSETTQNIMSSIKNELESQYKTAVAQHTPFIETKINLQVYTDNFCKFQDNDINIVVQDIYKSLCSDATYSKIEFIKDSTSYEITARIPTVFQRLKQLDLISDYNRMHKNTLSDAQIQNWYNAFIIIQALDDLVYAAKNGLESIRIPKDVNLAILNFITELTAVQYKDDEDDAYYEVFGWTSRYMY